jgi:hypothetical protein
MPFKDIIAVYCENHKERVNTVRGQTAHLFSVKAGGSAVTKLNFSLRKRLQLVATSHIPQPNTSLWNQYSNTRIFYLPLTWDTWLHIHITAQVNL